MTIDLPSESVFIHNLLDQEEVWYTRDGTRVRVSEMTPSHRRNAANMLIRNAVGLELWYSLGELGSLSEKRYPEVLGETAEGETVFTGQVFSSYEMMSENVQDAIDSAIRDRSENPADWIRTTTLVRALLHDTSTSESASS